MKKTRADYMDEIADTIMSSLAPQLSVVLSKKDGEAVKASITRGIAAGHAQFTCISCRDAAHHDSCLRALTALRNSYREAAGKLFANNQDHEARYLRDQIANADLANRIEEHRNLAMASMDSEMHLCTLHGDPPLSAL